MIPASKSFTLKKAMPVAPVVPKPVEVEVEEIASEDESVAESGNFKEESEDESDAESPTQPDPEEDSRKISVPLKKLIEYQKLAKRVEELEAELATLKATKPRGVDASKEYVYTAKGYTGLDITKKYTGGLVPYIKAKTGVASTGTTVYGVRVVNKKRETVISYKYEVVKFDKGGINPHQVKDSRTGCIHKVNGGKIEIATQDGIELVYVMRDVRVVA